MSALAASLVLQLAAAPSASLWAQGRPAPGTTGASLLAWIPPALAGHARTDSQAYSAFATGTYRLTAQTFATLQVHNVVGAGAAAWLARTCTRRATVAGHEACVLPRADRYALTWLFADSIQVNLSAPDEAQAAQLAAALDLSGLARLAERVHRAHPADR